MQRLPETTESQSFIPPFPNQNFHSFDRGKRESEENGEKEGRESVAPAAPPRPLLPPRASPGYYRLKPIIFSIIFAVFLLSTCASNLAASKVKAGNTTRRLAGGRSPSPAHTPDLQLSEIINLCLELEQSSPGVLETPLQEADVQHLQAAQQREGQRHQLLQQQPPQRRQPQQNTSAAISPSELIPPLPLFPSSPPFQPSFSTFSEWSPGAAPVQQQWMPLQQAPPPQQLQLQQSQSLHPLSSLASVPPRALPYQPRPQPPHPAATRGIFLTQQQRLPLQQQSMPPQQQHPPMQQQRLPLQQQRMPPQQQRMPPQQQYPSMQQQRLPLQQQSMPPQQQHPPMQQQRLPLQQQRLPLQQQHPPLQQQRLPVQQQRPPLQQQHLPMQQQWLPVQQQGPPMQQQQLPSQQVPQPQELQTQHNPRPAAPHSHAHSHARYHPYYPRFPRMQQPRTGGAQLFWTPSAAGGAGVPAAEPFPQLPAPHSSFSAAYRGSEVGPHPPPAVPPFLSHQGLQEQQPPAAHALPSTPQGQPEMHAAQSQGQEGGFPHFPLVELKFPIPSSDETEGGTDTHLSQSARQRRLLSDKLLTSPHNPWLSPPRSDSALPSTSFSEPDPYARRKYEGGREEPGPSKEQQVLGLQQSAGASGEQLPTGGVSLDRDSLRFLESEFVSGAPELEGGGRIGGGVGADFEEAAFEEEDDETSEEEEKAPLPLDRHPFYRLPVLAPGVSAAPFCAEAVTNPPPKYATPRVVYACLFSLRDLFLKDTLQQNEALAVRAAAVRLSNHMLRWHTEPLRPMPYSDIAYQLGRRYLMLDAIYSAILVLGASPESMEAFNKLAQQIPVDAHVAPDSKCSKTRVNLEIISRVIAALRKLKKGVRPSAEETVRVKRDLFTRLRHRYFKGCQYHWWRLDDQQFRRGKKRL
ncbi:hypothetical protein EBH_0007920 [Eimeria brunetti]|uniref:Uncharacterized protein n=1 Tax=Eimeria brunetti TaxID=51314 RepID=U6LTY4_9EIME|nr:hypothetical protein EBH_0007920 [Eimeria brunetti]